MTNPESSTDISRRLDAIAAELEAIRAEHVSGRASGHEAIVELLLRDLSRRRDAEQRLGRAEEWIQLAQEAGKVGAYTYDFHTGRLDWSASTQALFEWDLAAKQPTLDGWLARVHPDDLAAVRRVATAALEDGAVIDQRYRIVLPSGGVRWIQDRGRVLRDESGALERIVGLNIDITGERDILAALERSEERLQIALGAGRALGAWDWRVGEDRIFADASFAQMFGVDPAAAARGVPLDAFTAAIHPEDRPRVATSIAAAVADCGDYEEEYRVLGPGGERWVLARGRCAADVDGRAERFPGVCVDITARKEAELALARALALLGGIAQGTSDLIAAEDADYRYIFFNDAYAREFEALWGRELTLGTSMVEALAPWPEEQAKAVALWSRALAGESFSVVERFGPTPEDQRSYDLRFSPVRDASGRQIGAAHIFRDITDQVRARQALAEADDRRELLLRELNHRIKNLLAIVQAIAWQTLRGTDVPEGVRDAFHARLTALARAQEVIMAREAGPVDLAELIDTVLAPFGPAISGRVSRSGPPLPLSGSAAVAFALALHELATNAAKYGAFSTGRGSVAIDWTVATGGADLSLTWREADGPPIGPVTHRGFGSRLIERSLQAEIGGRVEMDFAPTGLVCTIAGTLLADQARPHI